MLQNGTPQMPRKLRQLLLTPSAGTT